MNKNIFCCILFSGKDNVFKMSIASSDNRILLSNSYKRCFVLEINIVALFKANNTFLLQLDGDMDFQPDAVIMLVDRMKKNMKTGAACGRLHASGKG